MDIRELLNNVAAGRLSVEEAEMKLKLKPFEDLDFAKPDLH